MDFVFGGGNGGAASVGATSATTSGAGANLPTTSASASAGATIGLSHENGPILYSEPNRTSAIDDIRSVVIYIFIITIFLSFFLILPGIRNEKFPTFLCITTSLIVTSIILISLFGTTWHVGEAPISAAYKAFSRDRIQGELNVKIGLQSVNITLKAYKYYILHATDGPIMMENSAPIQPVSMLMNMMSAAASSVSSGSKTTTTTTTTTLSPLPSSLIDNQLQENGPQQSKKPPQSTNSNIDSANEQQAPGRNPAVSSFIDEPEASSSSASNFADELLGGRTSDGSTVDTELEVEEVFADNSNNDDNGQNQDRAGAASRVRRQFPANENKRVSKLSSRDARAVKFKQQQPQQNVTTPKIKRQQDNGNNGVRNQNGSMSSASFNAPKFTIKRVDVDINYNERFYWIEPNQMKQEYHNALERGLPYPILTVVEYLSQDDAGFNWSRQYRAAGYYSSMLLWLSICVSILMFCLHCAAPKYGIYTMQVIGCLLLFTNLTYFTLVPKGEQKLVIPFEGQSLAFEFGWSFWLVLIGGCLSLIVGTVIVIIDSLFPNYIFTTILDVDYDSHQNKYYETRKALKRAPRREMITDGHSKIQFKPSTLDSFFEDEINSSKASSSSQSIASSSSPSSSLSTPNSTIRSRGTTTSKLENNKRHESRFSYNRESRFLYDKSKGDDNATTRQSGRFDNDIRVNGGRVILRKASTSNRLGNDHSHGGHSSQGLTEKNINHYDNDAESKGPNDFSQYNKSEKLATSGRGGSSVVNIPEGGEIVTDGISIDSNIRLPKSSSHQQHRSKHIDNIDRETSTPLGKSNNTQDYQDVRL